MMALPSLQFPVYMAPVYTCHGNYLIVPNPKPCCGTRVRVADRVLSLTAHTERGAVRWHTMGVPLEAGFVSRSMELELFASLPVGGQDEFVPVSPPLSRSPRFCFSSTPPAADRQPRPNEGTVLQT